jgi:hypothetical protein
MCLQTVVTLLDQDQDQDSCQLVLVAQSLLAAAGTLEISTDTKLLRLKTFYTASTPFGMN